MISDIAITAIETVSAFDIVTGKFKWMLDELQNVTIANSQETTDITGRQGRLLNTLKRNKAVTISGNNGLLSGGLLETQTGGVFKKKKTSVKVPDYLTVADNKAVTTYKATGTAGNEIDSVFIRMDDGTLGRELKQGTAVEKDVFTYDPATKELVFNEGDVPNGTEIAVYYFRELEADVLENMPNRYSEKVDLYCDGFGEDRCANIYRIQFHLPKADFNGNFDIQMGSDQNVHAFEARSLAGACGSSGALWTYTVFGEDTPDAA